MALTLRTDGSSSPNLVGAAWWNDYYDLLTGSMNDQPVFLYYKPGSSTTTPALELQTNANAPLLVGLSSTATQVLKVDSSGNMTLSGSSSASSYSASGNVSTTGGYHSWSASSVGSTNPTIFNMAPSGATTNVQWTLLYLGSSGTLDYWDSTNGVSCFQILPNDGGILIGGNSKLYSTGNDVRLQNNNGSGWLYLDYSNRLELSGGAFFDAGGNLTVPGTITGNITGNAGGTAWTCTNINTVRNGAGTTVPIYTGTNSPSGQPTGAIWIKA